MEKTYSVKLAERLCQEVSKEAEAELQDEKWLSSKEIEAMLYWKMFRDFRNRDLYNIAELSAAYHRVETELEKYKERVERLRGGNE